MSKIFWIAIMIVSSTTLVTAQDPYYDNPPQQPNNDDTYYQDNGNYDENQADNDGMSYQTFYDQLSPYGSWIDYPGRGYVWVPQVDANFTPYQTGGHWVYSDMGWTWVSDYEWGWAAFHYGRWFFDPDYGGWLWAPGYDWAPAWVTWGEYGGYYCWAPLGWGEPLYGSVWNDRHWCFVERGHICDEHIENHIVDHDRVYREAGGAPQINVISHSNTYNRSVFNSGPKREDVEKVIGHPVTQVRINNSPKPGGTKINGSQVNIYRPVISKSTTVQQKAIPTHLSRPEDVHPANNNNNKVNNQPAHTTPARTNETPARTNETPYRSNPTPPRQSTPKQDNQFRSEQQPTRSEPQQSRPSGGFVPSERPSAPAYHASPAPSYHAPAGGGGGFHGGGGGRH